MKIHNYMSRVIALVLFLFIAACSPDENSQEEEANNAEDLQQSEDEIAPAFAEIDDSADIIQDTVSPDDFETETIPSNEDVAYDIDLTMDEEGAFQLDTHVGIENQSDEAWKDLVFYVIPNAFTEDNKPEMIEEASDFEMESVQVNDTDIPYSLDDDTLALELDDPLESGESTEADITYTFTVPEEGFRFSQYEDDYFLGQFYPMLATYQDGWNKEDYNPTGESFHTDFSDFKIAYDIPKGYTVFSSDDSETSEGETTGEFEMEHIKEFFMAIMDSEDLEIQEEEYDGTEVRVITDEDTMGPNNYMDSALGSFEFFEENIGDYPHDQLDVIVTGDEDGGMEYPGIVTVMDSLQTMDEIVPHEIGHQWFYGMVSNDAFRDPLVDEGLTEFVTFLYLIDINDELGYDETVEYFQAFFDDMSDSDDVLAANLPLDGYEDDQEIYSYSVYQQPTYQLLTLFQDYGGTDKALAFLHDYFDTYQYGQIDTEELLNYLTSYLHITHDDAFEAWLDVNMAQDD